MWELLLVVYLGAADKPQNCMIFAKKCTLDLTYHINALIQLRDLLEYGILTTLKVILVDMCIYPCGKSLYNRISFQYVPFHQSLCIFRSLNSDLYGCQWQRHMNESDGCHPRFYVHCHFVMSIDLAILSCFSKVIKQGF